jgi:predicted XRE-type DNA-binding protein
LRKEERKKGRRSGKKDARAGCEEDSGLLADEKRTDMKAEGKLMETKSFHIGEEQLEQTEEDEAVGNTRRRGAEAGGQLVQNLDVGD